MEETPKRTKGRPALPGPKPVRVTAYLPPLYFADLAAIAREANRAVAYTAAEILKRAVDEYRKSERAAELTKQGLIPEAESQDDPITLRVPKESAAELIKAAAEDVAKGKV
jgi:hypothetical protein